MTEEEERLMGQDLIRNPWKLLLDSVPPDQIKVAYLEQILTALIRHKGKIPRPTIAEMRYLHTFHCRCCDEEVTMATSYKKAPYLCGDCELEANTLHGWCRFCDGIPDEMSVDEWRAMPMAERFRLRQVRQNLLRGRD